MNNNNNGGVSSVLNLMNRLGLLEDNDKDYEGLYPKSYWKKQLDPADDNILSQDHNSDNNSKEEKITEN